MKDALDEGHGTDADQFRREICIFELAEKGGLVDPFRIAQVNVWFLALFDPSFDFVEGLDARCVEVFGEL